MEVLNYMIFHVELPILFNRKEKIHPGTFSVLLDMLYLGELMHRFVSPSSRHENLVFPELELKFNSNFI